ncbi:MAG: hypothetical protein H6650_06985 [Ardenticatenales bacterium]|nr:hypothetical protein [Ardenticatenales bacterium]
MMRNERWVWWACLLGFLLAGVVLGDWMPALRGPAEWHWWLADPVPADRLLRFTAVAALFGLGWWGLGRWLANHPTRARAWLALSGLFLLITLLQTAYLGLFRANPLALQYEYVVSNQVSGYWTAAQELGPIDAALRDYPWRMPTFTADPHPRSKPPGIVLFIWGVQQALAKSPTLAQQLGAWARGIRCGDLWLAAQSNVALSSAVVVGVLTPLLSALALWPAYGLAARRWGAAAGWLAAGLTAILPGRFLFTPNFDTVYLMLTLLALYLLDTGVRRRRVVWTFFAGMILSLETFFSLVTGMAGLLAGLFLLFFAAWSNHQETTTESAAQSWWATIKSPRWRRFLLLHGLALGLGSAVIWAAYGLRFGVSPLAIYHAAAPARNDLRRGYGLWLGWNLVDFALFVGLPLIWLAAPWPTPGKRRAWLPLALAFWVTLLGFNLTGQIRAEVGRIWLIIAGIPPLLAAARPQTNHTRRWLLLSLLCLTWAMGLRWQVNPLEWPPPTPHATLAAPPPGSHPLQADFGPDITLRGYDLQTDDALNLTLYWQAHSQPQTAYTVFLHLLNAQGNIARQQDVMPQAGRLPTTCWQTGDIIPDEHTLPLTELPAGHYQIRVGLYNQATGEPLGAPLLLPAVSIP